MKDVNGKTLIAGDSAFVVTRESFDGKVEWTGPPVITIRAIEPRAIHGSHVPCSVCGEEDTCLSVERVGIGACGCVLMKISPDEDQKRESRHEKRGHIAQAVEILKAKA